MGRSSVGLSRRNASPEGAAQQDAAQVVGVHPKTEIPPKKRGGAAAERLQRSVVCDVAVADGLNTRPIAAWCDGRGVVDVVFQDDCDGIRSWRLEHELLREPRQLLVCHASVLMF